MRRALVVIALAGLAGCAVQPGQPAPAPTPAPDEQPQRSQATDAAPHGTLPPVPSIQGPLHLSVAYPGEGAALTASDSNFIFGSTGTGQAALRINGRPVEVAPNGAFLGFVPVPQDGVYLLEASSGAERATLTRRVRIPPAISGDMVDTARLEPRGTMTVRAGERVRVSLRGMPGATVRLILPDGRIVELREGVRLEREDDFARDRVPARTTTEYAGEFAARAPLRGGTGSPVLAVVPPDAGTARLEVRRGNATRILPLPLDLGILAEDAPRTAVVASARPDRQLIAAAVPGGGAPTAWPIPNGTRVALTGELNGVGRIQLTPELSVWADLGSMRVEPAGTSAPPGSVASVRVIPAGEWVDVRLGTSDRMPFRIDQDGRTLVVEVFGARSRSNWLYHGPEDAFVRRVSWEQPSDAVYRLRLDLARPAWGWRAWWDESGALVVRVRRPPLVDPEHPLAGIHVAVDAGHPPGGAIGPTGLQEADANLAIARRLAGMLREAGATVTETRPDTAAVALGERPLIAERAGAHLFVSVHNNAFPDGVNPFENNGTAAFYNNPPSAALAGALQHALVAELGLRDLGVALADLAVVRPTWMPSALTETMFLMVPEQENALRDPAVQTRIARAHARAIEAFLRAQVLPPD